MHAGERLDFVDSRWVERAERPYDPPLTENGKQQAIHCAKSLKDKVLL